LILQAAKVRINSGKKKNNRRKFIKFIKYEEIAQLGGAKIRKSNLGIQVIEIPVCIRMTNMIAVIPGLNRDLSVMITDSCSRLLGTQE
jgi:hypothetical protein